MAGSVPDENNTKGKMMGKRSDFERVERDFYPTPWAAVVPLIPHLPKSFTYWEPCAGDGQLVRHINRIGGDCVLASDICPLGSVNRDADFIAKQDALTMDAPASADFIVTNWPWKRSIMHPMIEHFAAQRPTWALFDADWMHTRQAKPFEPYCRKVVSVGRVKWIEGSKQTGKDNCAWYLFDAKRPGLCRFYFRD